MSCKQAFQSAAMGVAMLASAVAAAQDGGANESAAHELSAIAEEAYVYGYPLLVMDMTRRQLTSVPAPSGVQAPTNQFAVVEQLPDADFKAVVRPNVDTLYASAFLDLSREPMVLHVPDTKGRYYLLPMLDAYTNVFASPGARTTGTGAQDFAIVGPGWKGALPKGVTAIQAPTNMVWIIGRTEIRGRDDLANAVAVSKAYTLTPLSSFGRPYAPPAAPKVEPGIPLTAKPPDVVAKMSAEAFFTRLATLLKENPPPEADRAALERFAAIGLQPGRFAPTPEASRALRGVPQRGQATIASRVPQLGTEVNGWRVSTDLGSYGTRYLDRAAVALAGLGANLPEDAVYPQLQLDAQGQKLNGANAYVLHFDKGEAPPVKGFWSLTVYDPAGYLVANQIGRYAIGDRDPLRFNPDGSLDLYVQHRPPPPEQRSNWLPAPPGNFNLTLRMYWPEQQVLTREWSPPALEKRRPPAVGRRPRPD